MSEIEPRGTGHDKSPLATRPQWCHDRPDPDPTGQIATVRRHFGYRRLHILLATQGPVAEPQEVAADPMVTRPVLLPQRAFGFVNFARVKQAELPALLWSQALRLHALDFRSRRGNVLGAIRNGPVDGMPSSGLAQPVSVSIYLIIDALIQRWHVPAALHPSVWRSKGMQALAQLIRDKSDTPCPICRTAVLNPSRPVSLI